MIWCGEKMKAVRLMDFLMKDKVLHFLVCLVVTVLACSAMVSIVGVVGIIIGALIALMVGIVKEMIDIYVERDNTVDESKRDAIYDILGILVGVGISYLLYLLKLL